MKTDYQKLNTFESSVVVFIVIGVGLLGTIIFSALNAGQQNNLQQALNILDVHRQVAQSVESIKTMAAIQQEFYDQFYIAFTQVAVLPEETFEVPAIYFQTALNAFADYSDQFAYNYRIVNSNSEERVYGPIVAGTVIALADSWKNPPRRSVQEKTLSPPEVDIPYSFAPPQWQPIKNELIKIWTQ